MNIAGFKFKLAVFDLDETLWDGKCLYADVKAILSTLKSAGIHTYIASFNTDAYQTCKTLDIIQYFDEIHFGRDKSKYQMIKDIIMKHPYINESDVVFYDDNHHNISDVKSRSKIHTVHIGKSGITWTHITFHSVVNVSNSQEKIVEFAVFKEFTGYSDDWLTSGMFPDFFDDQFHLSEYARLSRARHKIDE